MDSYKSTIGMHKLHVGKLELIMRLIVNNTLDVDKVVLHTSDVLMTSYCFQVNEIRDSVEYYIQMTKEEEDIDANDYGEHIYEELGLDDQELSMT